MNATDHKIRILTEPEHMEGLAVCDRCHGGEIDLETPCVERMEKLYQEAKQVNKNLGDQIEKLAEHFGFEGTALDIREQIIEQNKTFRLRIAGLQDHPCACQWLDDQLAELL